MHKCIGVNQVHLVWSLTAFPAGQEMKRCVVYNWCYNCQSQIHARALLYLLQVIVSARFATKMSSFLQPLNFHGFCFNGRQMIYAASTMWRLLASCSMESCRCWIFRNVCVTMAHVATYPNQHVSKLLVKIGTPNLRLHKNCGQLWNWLRNQ